MSILQRNYNPVPGAFGEPEPDRSGWFTATAEEMAALAPEDIEELGLPLALTVLRRIRGGGSMFADLPPASFAIEPDPPSTREAEK